MTIKDVEERTGLARSNIRFYEKEKLIKPGRNESNGYRDYSEENVEDIEKIAYLRTLGISIEDIRNIIDHKVSLYEIIEEQVHKLDNQMVDLEKARSLCEKMMESDEISYEGLKIHEYVEELPGHWKANTRLFKQDIVSFLYVWGGGFVWGVITFLCLLIAIVIVPALPTEIPIQWSGSVVTSYVSKGYIFAYPAACIIIRFLLRPLIWNWLRISAYYSFTIADYLANFLCFVALTIELFTILFIYSILKSVTLVIFLDVIVFFCLLFMGLNRLSKESAE